MPDKDYSHRDVTDKLGLKQGFVVRVVGKGAPDLPARAPENRAGADAFSDHPRRRDSLLAQVVLRDYADADRTASGHHAQRRHLGRHRQAQLHQRRRHGLLQSRRAYPAGGRSRTGGQQNLLPLRQRKRHAVCHSQSGSKTDWTYAQIVARRKFSTTKARDTKKHKENKGISS